MTCGWLTAGIANFLAGESGSIKVPVPCYLIDHPQGKVLFDSGLHADTMTDPVGRLGELRSSLFDVDFKPGEDVASRLASLEVSVDDIRYVVGSHLHWDHMGGLSAVPNARLVVQKPEWQAGHDDDMAAANSFDRKDYDLGHDVMEVDGEHDLFGDGSLTLLPTYGHTPGHQSLQVRLASGDVVLSGDACYMRRSLEEILLPAVAYDEELMVESLRRLRVLRDRGARIFYGHDPEFWKTVPQAPAAVD